MAYLIRPETAADAPAIADVTRRAFHDHPHSNHAEHRIVAALRRKGALAISLLAELDGQVVGHVAFSPVSVSDASPAWYGLGPLSVLPAYRGRGIGQAMVRQGLESLRGLGAAGCVVLGEAAYYRRFGFFNPRRLALEGVPPEYFLAIAFAPAGAQGLVRYDAAFDEA